MEPTGEELETSQVGMITKKRAREILAHYQREMRLSDVQIEVSFVKGKDLSFDMRTGASGSDGDNRHRFFLDIAEEALRMPEDRFCICAIHEFLHQKTWHSIDIARFGRHVLPEDVYRTLLNVEAQFSEDLAYWLGPILARHLPRPPADASQARTRAGRRDPVQRKAGSKSRRRGIPQG